MYVEIKYIFFSYAIIRTHNRLPSFRVTDILGYRTVDLLGKLCYDFYAKEDVQFMMENYVQGK